MFFFGPLAGQFYAPLPYGTGFESGSLDANWLLSASPAGGRIQFWTAADFAVASPHGGQFHLGMDVPPPGNTFITNRADMRLNLAGEENVSLSFWWMEWNDETHPQDGVFLSVNGGASFTKIYDFLGSVTTDLEYQAVILDLSTIAADAGLTLSANTIIRFQQYDNFFFNGGNDGIFIDDIYVSSTTCDLPVPTTTDLIACGPDQYTLVANTLNGNLTWFDDQGTVVGSGTNFQTPIIESTTSYYVASTSQVNYTWDFDNDAELWSATNECDLDRRWEHSNVGGGSMYASNPTGGPTSQLLASPPINVENSASVDLSFDHFYNTETCCDHGYVVYRVDGGQWIQFTPDVATYNVFDFMYNDPFFGACGNSPDLDVFAGDNGGFETSSGQIFLPEGAQTLEVAFFYSTDPSGTDDGWYISNVSMDLNCESPRKVVAINFPDLNPGPIAEDRSTCGGSMVTLTAQSTSNDPTPDFNWYQNPDGTGLLGTGSTLDVNAVSNTTVYVEEVSNLPSLNLKWTFDNDLENFNTSSNCGFSDTWVWDDEGGIGAVRAAQSNGGNSSMNLFSQQVPVSGLKNLNFSFKHRFNTEACCDHGYVLYRFNAGQWQFFEPEVGDYNLFDFMYNDPFFGACGFSPDTTVFAGDSEGYILSAGDIVVPDGATNVQFNFFYSSDPSFVDDAWYIDEVALFGSTECPSALTPVNVFVTDAPSAPTAEDVDFCQGYQVTLEAQSTSGFEAPYLEWFDVPSGGSPVGSGLTLTLEPATNGIYYVEEKAQNDLFWDFTSTSFVGWSESNTCGWEANEWVTIDDAGTGAAYFSNVNGGNSSANLMSPLVPIENSQELFLSFDHRYNTETCCDHGYVVYSLDGGDWELFVPETGTYNVFDFMYNDPYFGNCGFSPDTTVFAGDSGGYITSSGSIDVAGASTIQLNFFFSSDPSAVDDGWYIDEVFLGGIVQNDCASPRTAVQVVSPVLLPPSSSDIEVCPPEFAMLSASSNSGAFTPEFEWFSDAGLTNIIGTEAEYEALVASNSTFYVREVIRADQTWTFDEDTEDMLLSTTCGLNNNPWQWTDDDGNGTLFARQENGGNSSMFARTPNVNISQTEGSVELSFRHRYNTESCCDHGYVMYRYNNGNWNHFEPEVNEYNIVDFMYNDPFYGGCGFSPDTTVFAGESGGYITSSGRIDASPGNLLQIAFFYSSDASFVDDGWYIDEISISGITTTCVSPPTAVDVTIGSSLALPTGSGANTCPGGTTTLTAMGNSSLDGTTLDWYDAASGGNLLSTGEQFTVAPQTTTTYYVQETGSTDWLFDFEDGFDGWFSESDCDLPGAWELVDDNGTNALFAQQLNGGNSSMTLKSPVIPLDGQNVLSYSFNHRYNTETCCDHGYFAMSVDGGPFNRMSPSTGPYNVFDFMYNDPYLGNCGFSPDINIYAGDSGGYITSSGLVLTIGASTVQFAFLYTSDPTAVDDGWYIDNFTVTGVFDPCVSPRLPVTVTVENLQAPSLMADVPCSGGSALLTATSNSAAANTTFEWYSDSGGNNLIGIGNPFNSPPVSSNTFFYAREIKQGQPFDLVDNFNAGTNNAVWLSILGGQTDQVCGSVDGDALRMSASGTRRIRTNQFDVSNGGTISFDLKISNEATAGCEAAEPGEDVVLEYSVGGSYTIISTYDQDSYPDFTSITEVIPPAAQGPNTIFQLRQLSNSGLDFDVWAIDNFQITGMMGNECESSLSAVFVSPEALPAPTATGDDICPGETAVLTASSNSGRPGATMEWFSAPNGGFLIGVGDTFERTGLTNDVTYYVSETVNGNINYGFTNSFQGWTTTSYCDLDDEWMLFQEGFTAGIMANNPSGGNTSMGLISPVWDISGTDQVDISFAHRYNTETCCDHGYVLYRLDGGDWEFFEPNLLNDYNVFDFMYNDPFLGDCGFSPDTTVYAGDSGGYITSAGPVQTNGASTLEFQFFYSSDPSFVDEGWFLNSFNLGGLGNGCTSQRVPVTVTVGNPNAPVAADVNICTGETASLVATATSGNTNPVFRWFDAPTNGNLLFEGENYVTDQIFTPQTIYVEEVVLGSEYTLFDPLDAGTDTEIWGSILGAQTDAICGAVAGNSLRFNAFGTRAATTTELNVDRGATINFELKISQEATTGCEAAEVNEEVVLEYNAGAGWFTNNTFDITDYPDFTLISIEIPEAAQSEATRFRLRQLSNSGQDFDVWAIDNFQIIGTEGAICRSDRIAVNINPTDGAAPSVNILQSMVCDGDMATLDAVPSGNLPNPIFDWYDAPTGGNLLFTGETYTPVINGVETFYLQESDPFRERWTFDTDLEGWSSLVTCNLLSSQWAYSSDGGAGAAYATNSNGGSSSQSLRSPIVDVAGQASVNLSYRHRYNTETCCDHGYVQYRLDGGPWEIFMPEVNDYNIFDFMYNDPYIGGCGNSPDTTVYAGDSGGYITSSGSINTAGASELEVQFFYSSDPSFVDDGWYIDEVDITNLGTGCTSVRTEVTVEGRPCCSPFADFEYIDQNSTILAGRFCYTDPTSDWVHFFSTSDPLSLLFSVNGIRTDLGFPFVVLDQNGQASINSIPPVDCTPGSNPPDTYIEMARVWDFDLNGSVLEGPTANIRFYVPPQEIAAFNNSVSGFLSTFAGCNYIIDADEWFKSPDGVTYFQGDYDGSQFQLATQSGAIYGNTATDNTAYYVELTVDGFSGGGLGATLTSAGVPLPVELVAFTAEKYNDRMAMLRWDTESEIDNDLFIVERSIDGIQFEEIGEVDGAGTTSIPQSYSLLDRNPQLGINYYRLKIVDFEGNFEYSGIRTLEFEADYEVVVRPNPFVDQFALDLVSETEKNARIRVFDVAGRLVERRRIDLGTGLTTVPFATTGKKWIAGMYFIEIDTDDGPSKILKVVKAE
ncbi:MAG: T9SS type A sorting domain-containing protein [Bacteroidota bacterium]